MFKIIHLKEGLRLFKRALKVRKKGVKQYKGNAEEICRQIIEGCWNGYFFQTSNGHFCEFWTRDFTWCIESLIQQGYRNEVIKTIEYALNVFSKHNKITTTISPNNVAFDFPYYAVDSLPYLIRSLRIINNKELINAHKCFLNKELLKFYNIVLDKDTGLVKKDKRFSSIRDYAIRKSSCYDNIMVAMLNNDLKKIGMLDNPLKQYNFKRIIKDNFWHNTHFIDDLSRQDFITGDANIFPFWSNVFNEKKMLRSALLKIQESGLDKPFPLRYYHQKHKEQDMLIIEVFAKNYERDTIWMHMGPIYITLVKKINKNKFNFYIEQYKEIIEKHKNYLEVFNPDGSIYKTFFYHADEGMLWSSMFLGLIK
jgi:hypothetical protein